MIFFDQTGSSRFYRGYIEAKMKLTFKDDLHSQNLVGNQATSRLRNVHKIIKIDQYLLFFIDILAEAKCGGRPLRLYVQQNLLKQNTSICLLRI